MLFAMRNKNWNVRRATLAAVVLLAMSAGCSVFNDNFRPVAQGAMYRSGQLSAMRIEYFVNKHGIRTIINLRGSQPDEQWYRDEVAACERLGVAHHDLEWSMKRIPEPDSLSQLVNLFDSADRPILVHCHAGVHRAGVASAAYKLMEGASADDASRQFGLFFLGAPIGRVLELYADSDRPFREWVIEDYPALYGQETRIALSAP
jgi:protein tyrosine phosphatase (PTP) superfamily phosphohydrolase (DUF442 family)